MRFHFTLADAQLQFGAQETTTAWITASAFSCCGSTTSALDSHSATSMVYKQASRYSTSDFTMPLSARPFYNMVVTRLSRAEATLLAGQAVTANSAASSDCSTASVMKALRALCGIFTALYTRITTCGLSSLPTLSDVCAFFSNLSPSSLSSPSPSSGFRLPCLTGVTEWRLMYPCCSPRCLSDVVGSMCGLQRATLTSIKSEHFETHETYELGRRESTRVKRTTYRNANEPASEETQEEEWKCFGPFEYKGQLCSCDVAVHHNGTADESTSIVFESAGDDEVYLNFEFRDAEEEADAILGDEGEGAIVSLPALASLPAAIRLKLEVRQSALCLTLHLRA